MVQRSKIFERNRALGFVSSHVPCVVRYIKMRNENLVATVVGRCFHTYGCNRFSVLSVSGLHPADITCLAADTFHIYTCCDTEIYAWRRGTELKHTYKGHLKPVHIILPLGAFLLSVDEDSVLKLWDVKSEEELLEYPFSNDTFQISAVIHPATYLNKVLLGSKQGTLQLLNIHTSKLIHTFRGWNCEVTVLQQAPAVDVIAVGLANGRIILHNIKYDQTVMMLIQDWGTVTSISFRSDGPAMMLSGSLSGHIVLWDLEERKPLTQLVSAHSGAVAGMKCLANEPLMVTSSPDNTLKMWIFDMPDGGARLLRIREGHSSPPTFIRYHGNNGHNIVSAGSDSSMRIFSTLTETFNKSLGKARYKRNKKIKKSTLLDDENPCMPPVVFFASETTREKEWDDIAAIHLGMGVVTTWSYGKVKMGDLKLIPDHLKPKTFQSANQISATCLTLTSCGNFVVIGYNTGDLHKFNIQSGLHRGAYGSPTAHKGPVRGVGSDSLNQVVVSGGHDCCIKFWSFKVAGSEVLSQLVLDEPVLFFHVHRESSLLAIALEDYNVLVMDLDTRLVIRKFEAHMSQLTDMAFSPDAHWLVTASLDCTIRTWDIPSAHLVDVFQVDAPCTSLTFSPTGDRLATTHVNCLGVFLWANRCVFEHVSLSPVRDLTNIPLVALPSTAQCVEPSDYLSEIDDPIENMPKTNEQISEELITLSSVSSSRWQNLLNLDIVWKKNKPKSLLKKPKTAPFFLPTIPSLDLQFDLKAENNANEESANAFQLKTSTTGFAKLLFDSVSGSDFDKAMIKLKELSLSTINFEISALSPEGGGSLQMIRQFMKLVQSVLKTNRNFELIQAYFALFLKKHGDTIASEMVLCDELQLLQTVQLDKWNVLQNKLMSCLCVVDSLKSM
ncbi:Protein will die slowly [Gryllus bimaculatus]|nr:Protein will die slowly [Gryllus bimaculatus]